jgi:mono/diheme cytochrome c family protein
MRQVKISDLVRWSPFLGLTAIAVIVLIRLLVQGTVSPYQTGSTDGALIYQEACSGCHGLHGEAVHFYIPDLADEKLSVRGVSHRVPKGGLFMPAFVKLDSMQIAALSRFVADKNFK